MGEIGLQTHVDDPVVESGAGRADAARSAEAGFSEPVRPGSPRLWYVQQGPKTGPAVIMLHGSSDSSFSFSRVLPLLPPSIRVIVPDQRGHGRSDRAPGDYSMHAMARDVIDLMDALAVPTATIVGHSMGSFVARRAAALEPDRITRLVLVGAGLRADNDVILEVQRAANAQSDPVDPAFVRAFQLSTMRRPVPPEFLDTVIAESLRLDAATWRESFAGLIGYEPAESRIHVPVSMIGGDADAVFAVHEQRALEASISGASLRVLEDVGHAPHWEVPGIFVSELLPCLGVRSS
jgi:pimeloyl-ACP methyl ester carboxylesterase